MSPVSPALQADSLLSEPPGKPIEELRYLENANKIFDIQRSLASLEEIGQKTRVQARQLLGTPKD